jgi:DNA-directed RNA polymerase sigma subunit (sigma70/sigma32)
MKAWEGRGTVYLEETPDWTPAPLVDASNPLEGYEAAQDARDLLERLEPRQREALALRHGLKTGYPMKYADIGEVMRCSKQRAQQIVKAAERRLKRWKPATQ